MTNSSNKKEKTLIIAAVAIVVVLIGLFLGIQLSSKEYLVKFNTNGGSPIESVKVKENKMVKKPNDPTKDGYAFGGWYYENKEFDFNTKITKDITLEAHWTEDGIVLNSKSMSILLGDKKKVEILSLPNGIKMQDLVYSSSNKEVLTVDEEGNITTLKKGSATITIKTKDGKYTAKVEITVTEEEVNPESIAIFGFETLAIGETVRLGITYEPDNATNLNFKWSSDNPTVATVDQSGNVTGRSEGTATITVESANGLKATHKISVYKYNAPTPTPSPTPEPTPEPTPSEPEVKDPVYILYLQKNKLDLADGIQYTFYITKDGVAFDEYTGFTLNENKADTTSFAKSEVTVYKDAVENRGSRARIVLSDESVVYASIVVLES